MFDGLPLFDSPARPEPVPAAPKPVETNYGTADKPHRQQVLELLKDGRWHNQVEMRLAGGDRYGARVHELRGRGFNVVVEQLGAGVYRWRLSSEPVVRPPTRSWKARALFAEARVRELEALFDGGK